MYEKSADRSYLLRRQSPPAAANRLLIPLRLSSHPFIRQSWPTASLRPSKPLEEGHPILRMTNLPIRIELLVQVTVIAVEVTLSSTSIALMYYYQLAICQKTPRLIPVSQVHLPKECEGLILVTRFTFCIAWQTNTSLFKPSIK